MKKERRIKKDAKVLHAFIGAYCRENHQKRTEGGVKGPGGGGLCPECDELLRYALKRNEKCPLDPKPMCKKCTVHCYKPEMREKIKEVMKFSGIHFVKKGRLYWLFHYFF